MNMDMMIPGPSGQTEYNFARIQGGYIVGVTTMYGEAAKEYHTARYPNDIECVKGTHPSTHHGVYGRIEPKLHANVILRGNVLIGVPAPCLVLIEGEDYEVEAGVTELELNFEAPGKYKVRVTMNPEYFDEEFEIEKVD